MSESHEAGPTMEQLSALQREIGAEDPSVLELDLTDEKTALGFLIIAAIHKAMKRGATVSLETATDADTETIQITPLGGNIGAVEATTTGDAFSPGALNVIEVLAQQSPENP